LYSAARNLGEFGCPPALAHALLTEPGLDCGLAPKDVHRQIECGLKDQGPPAAAVEQPATPSSAPEANTIEVQKQIATFWQAPTPPVEQPSMPAVKPPAAEPAAKGANDVQKQIAAFWRAPTPAAEQSTPAAPTLPIEQSTPAAPTPPVELIPENGGDALELPQDRRGVGDPSALLFPFEADGDGPYTKGGGRR